MRDKLKNKDYFNKFIEKRKLSHDKRVQKLYSNSIAQERIEIVKSDMSLNKLSEIIAKFSGGYDLHELSPDLLVAIDLAKEGWKGAGSWKLINDKEEFNQYTFTGFYYMLNMLSLAYLLDISNDKFQLLVDIIDRDNVKDKLFEFIISAKLENRKPVELESYRKYFGIPDTFAKAREIIDVQDKSVAEQLMKVYLSKHWYKQHKETGLKDNHKSKHDLYYGYWSFEAAVVVKIMELDDSSFIDNQYYPKDLVHLPIEEPKTKGFLGKLGF